MNPNVNSISFQFRNLFHGGREAINKSFKEFNVRTKCGLLVRKQMLGGHLIRGVRLRKRRNQLVQPRHGQRIELFD